MSKKKNKSKDMPVAGTSNPGVKIEAGVFIDFDTTFLSAKDKDRLKSLVAGFQGVYGEREKVINELNALTMQLVLIDGAIEKFRTKAEKKSLKKVIETDDPGDAKPSKKKLNAVADIAAKATKKALKAEKKAAKQAVKVAEKAEKKVNKA